MLAAIEIYNKPQFEYRDEVFTQLLINSWELLLKAMVSRSRHSIYYKKVRGQPYRTLSWSDAFNRARTIWPPSVPPDAVSRNLELLGTYRDNSVHFYNEPGFGVLVYSLAQTSISNYRRVLEQVFQQDLADDINWSLMPLGVRAPIGPLEYLSGHRSASNSKNPAVEEFVLAIQNAAKELESKGIGTECLLTIFDVSLQSTKKIAAADIVVGIDPGERVDSYLVKQILDPNRSHPLRRKDVISLVQNHGNESFNSRSFDAVVWRRDYRNVPSICWTDESTGLSKWSRDLVTALTNLSSSEIEDARQAYSTNQRAARHRKRTNIE